MPKRVLLVIILFSNVMASAQVTTMPAEVQELLAAVGPVWRVPGIPMRIQ